MKTLTPAHKARMLAARKAKNSTRTKRPSYKALIKAKCLDCSGNQVGEVRNCTVTSCPLHQIRPFQSK